MIRQLKNSCFSQSLDLRLIKMTVFLLKNSCVMSESLGPYLQTIILTCKIKEHSVIYLR